MSDELAKAHRAHMLTCLTGARAMLSHLFYAQATHEHSAWMRSYDNNHHAGGVMDHLASLIESLEPEQTTEAEATQ